MRTNRERLEDHAKNHPITRIPGTPRMPRCPTMWGPDGYVTTDEFETTCDRCGCDGLIITLPVYEGAPGPDEVKGLCLRCKNIMSEYDDD